MSPLIAIPAAGASARMRGRDKLMELVEGMPLLRRQTLEALKAGCPVVVLIAPDQVERQKSVAGLDVETLFIPDASEGMSASLRRAANHAAPQQDLGILLPDIPGVRCAEIAAVYAAFCDQKGAEITRGSDPESRPGTPIFFPHDRLSEFTNLTGDDGGRSLINPNRLILHKFPDDRATRDLDTPEDWTAWRTETGL